MLTEIVIVAVLALGRVERVQPRAQSMSTRQPRVKIPRYPAPGGPCGIQKQPEWFKWVASASGDQHMLLVYTHPEINGELDAAKSCASGFAGIEKSVTKYFVYEMRELPDALRQSWTNNRKHMLMHCDFHLQGGPWGAPRGLGKSLGNR